MIAATDLSASRIAFFATSATVIPVLMIALGLQIRSRVIIGGWLGSARPSTQFAAGRLLAVVWALTTVLFVGEAFAVNSLVSDRNDGTGLVTLSLVVGFVFLWGSLLHLAYEEMVEWRKEIAEAATDEQPADATKTQA